MKTVAFFNNKGGVGKTSLVFHLAWMLQDMGLSVLAVDLDPQSNLTSIFLDESRLENLWTNQDRPGTILDSLRLLVNSIGDIQPPVTHEISSRLALLAGDLGLGEFEDRLSEAWGKCLNDKPAIAGDGFRVMSAFHRVIKAAAADRGSDLVLIDVGPSIGAMNRAALVAADFVVVPLGADLFSLQGLHNLGPALRDWRTGWTKRLGERVPEGLSLPAGSMKPLGYVLLNPSVRDNQPVKAYQKWADRIPEAYARDVLGESAYVPAASDSNQLAMLRHFKSLMPMAQDARKPMFHLTAADGAIGGHAAAVNDCRIQFKQLAGRILAGIGVTLP